MTGALLSRLLELLASKKPAVVATALAIGEQRLIEPGDTLAADADVALREDRCRTVEQDGKSWFLRPYNPPLRLVIVGAVHLAQPLAVMAAETGYQVAVVDPRSAFATAERFPGVKLYIDWPEAAFAKIGPDARTAVVVLTHDPKIDDPALTAALSSPAFYVGALGSKRSHANRCKRLEASGVEGLERINGPVGLNIGARSPAEIALSILAQMTETLRLR